MIFETIQQDIITAMKAKDEHTVVTLRMAKNAIQNKEKEKHTLLTEEETQAVLSTLIKQRKDSVEQFTKGGRPELAAKEAAEIIMIEKYLPREATAEEIALIVDKYATETRAGGGKLIMGLAMSHAKSELASLGVRVDGKLLSTVVKAAIAG